VIIFKIDHYDKAAGLPLARPIKSFNDVGWRNQTSLTAC
jgi:hypothetical protein